MVTARAGDAFYFRGMALNPDQETLALLRRRDPRGFEQAYARYAPRLFAVAASVLAYLSWALIYTGQLSP